MLGWLLMRRVSGDGLQPLLEQVRGLGEGMQGESPVVVALALVAHFAPWDAGSTFPPS